MTMLNSLIDTAFRRSKYNRRRNRQRFVDISKCIGRKLNTLSHRRKSAFEGLCCKKCEGHVGFGQRAGGRASVCIQVRHFQGEVILWAVRSYCRYGISYRDLEQMMGERGVSLDHSTIYRWIQGYAPEMEKRLRWQWHCPRSTSWRVDETYVKVRGIWPCPVKQNL
jgi:hypothetical protein